MRFLLLSLPLLLCASCGDDRAQAERDAHQRAASAAAQAEVGR
jgi:hypothetical protein